MLNEEAKTTAAQELPDGALEQVAGGSRYTKEIVDMVKEAQNTKREVLRKDSRGRPIQWKWTSPDGTVSIFHFVCPTCGRWMHFGTLGALYCDPCDSYYLTEDSQEACRVKDL